jgi:hypothetical protein
MSKDFTPDFSIIKVLEGFFSLLCTYNLTLKFFLS